MSVDFWEEGKETERHLACWSRQEPRLGMGVV